MTLPPNLRELLAAIVRARRDRSDLLRWDPSTRSLAQDYAASLLDDEDALFRHLRHVEGLLGGKLDRTEFLSDERTLTAAERGLGELSDEELAALLLHPVGLVLLRESMDDLSEAKLILSVPFERPLSAAAATEEAGGKEHTGLGGAVRAEPGSVLVTVKVERGGSSLEDFSAAAGFPEWVSLARLDLSPEDSHGEPVFSSYAVLFEEQEGGVSLAYALLEVEWARWEGECPALARSVRLAAGLRPVSAADLEAAARRDPDATAELLDRAGAIGYGRATDAGRVVARLKERLGPRHEKLSVGATAVKLPGSSSEIWERLTGEANVLWIPGCELLKRGAASDLETALADWLPRLEGGNNWHAFKDSAFPAAWMRSRAQVRALAEVLLAAAALGRGRDDAARAGFFATSLWRAFAELRGALATEDKQVAAAPAGGALADFNPGFADSQGPVKLAQELLRRLAAAAARSAGPAHSGASAGTTSANLAAAAALWDLLTAAAPELAGLRPRRVCSQEPLPLLVVAGDHRVLEVGFELFESPDGAPAGDVLFPDVAALGATSLGHDFVKAAEMAMDYALRHSRKRPVARGRAWCRWSLRGAERLTRLHGRSAGGLFAAALLGLFEGVVLDPDAAVTATLEEDDALGGVGSSALLKAAAAASGATRRPVKALVLSEVDFRDYAASIHAASSRDGHSGLAVLQAATPFEAREHLRTERAAVLEFLRRMAVEERALQGPHVKFLPRHRSPWRVSEFLLSPRVRRPQSANRDDEGDKQSARRHLDDDVRDPRGQAERKDVELFLDQELAGFDAPCASPRHAVVEGPPGAGKSTLLGRQFTRHAARFLQRLAEGKLSHDATELVVPLLLPLRGLLGATGELDLKRLACKYVLDLAYTEEDLKREGQAERRAQVEAWLERKLAPGKNEVVLYLDAYDELLPDPVSGAVPSLEPFSKALQALEAHNVLVTTRPTRAEEQLSLCRPERYETALLSSDDIELYIERSFPREHAARGEEVIESLRQTPGPRSLVVVPLFLALFCEHAAEPGAALLRGGAPRTRLVEECLLRFLRRALGEERLRLALPEAELAGLDWEELYDEVFDALAQIAWRHRATDAQEMDQRDLKQAMAGRTDSLLGQALGGKVQVVEAFLRVGFFVRGREARKLSIVLETMREYLVARWAAKARVDFRTEELSDSKWSYIWPFVVGVMEGEERQRRVLEALRGECEKQHDDKQRARLLRTLARACAEAKAKAREGIDGYVVKELSGLIRSGVERDACLRALAENASEPAIRAVTGFATLRPADEWDPYKLRVDALESLAGSGNRQVIAELERAAGDASETPDLSERTKAALVRRRRRAAGGEGESFDAAALDDEALRLMAKDSRYRRLDHWTRKDGRKLAQYEHRETGVVLVLLPAGEFLMGSPPGERDRDEIEFLHPVRLRPFLMARYALAAEVYDGWIDADGRLKDQGPHYPDAQQAEWLPKVVVTWNDAWRFCARFGWTLPAEAQWEYACRAGTATRYAFGDELRPEDANFNESGKGGVCPVGEYRPNDFGLFQMHGNVWEWCHDVWSPAFYLREEAKGPDPLCLAGSVIRVLRGGSWSDYARSCRSANRDWDAAAGRWDSAGFRPAAVVAP
jgi:formylglycine-generating enzyme required for sulfatase activity